MRVRASSLPVILRTDCLYVGESASVGTVRSEKVAELRLSSFVGWSGRDPKGRMCSVLVEEYFFAPSDLKALSAVFVMVKNFLR